MRTFGYVSIVLTFLDRYYYSRLLSIILLREFKINNEEIIKTIIKVIGNIVIVHYFFLKKNFLYVIEDGNDKKAKTSSIYFYKTYLIKND